MLPRFSLRAALAILTIGAFVSVLLAAGDQGKDFALGVFIALATLGLALGMHGAFYGVTWLVGRLYRDIDPSKYAVTVEPVYPEAVDTPPSRSPAEQPSEPSSQQRQE